MKNSAKQTVLTILCIVIVFIPTYIAITYFSIRSNALKGNRYEVEITAYNGAVVAIEPSEVDNVAKTVLKMNSKLKATVGIDTNALPEKYYDIKVTDNGVVHDYRYYFSLDKNKRSLVKDINETFYYLDFNDAKAFLSRECSYMFYENSSLPTLSIFGGDDVAPVEAEWKFKAVSGSFVNTPNIELSSGDDVYAMSGKNKLSFSITPDTCTIKVYRDGTEILKTSDLSAIPYNELDSASMSFVISAEWTSSSQYRGSAEYRFSSSIGKAPEFFIGSTTIESGEFFVVAGTNISAPQKIVFSSSPEINYTPVFFSEGDCVYALIPIDKELLPKDMDHINYTFTFKYGDAVTEINTTVTKRSAGIQDREYNCDNISVSRNDKTIAEYNKLLTEIGSKSEQVRYFGSEFINYETLYDDAITIMLGFGHNRIPSNGDAAFRLDGVDYILAAGVDIPAIAAGKVVYTGSSALLGNFVVVDHGFGLKTWYCHLSDVISTVGKVVAKGETVGKAGNTGYTNSTGIYLITTVMDVPVSPYPLQEEGLVLPSVK